MRTAVVGDTRASAGADARLSGRHVPQLDALRTLAVASVAWVHWAPTRYHFGLPWGTGVQLFYVLSGFLITGILLDVAPRAELLSMSQRLGIWRRFYARRILRIFPLFYAVLAVTLVLGIDPIARTWHWHAAYLSNFYYFHLGHWGEPREPFRHLWSLSVEEQFYLVWPFLMLLAPRRAVWKILAAVIVLAPVFRAAVGLAIANPPMANALPLSCLDALGIGSLLSYAVRFPIGGVKRAESLARWCLLVGLCGSALAGVVGHSRFENLFTDSVGHTCLVLLYGAVVYRAFAGFRGIAGRVLEWPVLVYPGKISYGVYVMHLFVPLATVYAANQMGMGGALAASFPLQLAVNTLVTVMLAALSWHLFELPLNNLKRFFPYAAAERAEGTAMAVEEVR